MSNVRDILKKKIIQELYNDSESTHYDTVANRKIKIFPETIDPIKNTVKAEITSGKNKGLFTMVNLDNLVELNPSKMVAEGESGYYPPGAEFDSRAPWNEKDSPDVSKYTFDDTNQEFNVTLTNGNTFEIPYIDVLEKYWKNHPSSFEQHNTEFEEMDDKADIAIIRKLESENFNFSNYLYDIAESSGKLEEENDDYDYEIDDDF
jgi:hypothetical protein